MVRRSPGDGTLFKRASDGLWVAGYTVVIDGRPMKKRVSHKTRNGAIAKRKELKKQLDAGVVPGATNIRMDRWLDHWLNNIKKPKVDPTTFRSYDTVVRLYLKPTIGHLRMDRLTTDHVREMHKALQTGMAEAPGSTRNAQKAHQTLGAALKIAMAELGLQRNVAALVGMPEHVAKKHPAFSVSEALHIMNVADEVCDQMWAARWRTGFMTGKRECEVLGITWPRLDLDSDLIDISWQLQELTKSHGCGPKGEDGYPCGKKRVSFCPDAHWDFRAGFEHEFCEGNLVWTRPKTASTERVQLPVIKPLHDTLTELRALPGPNPHDLVFHHPDGSPISQSQDQKAWQKLLKAAGVPHRRQHTLRRTAITLLRHALVDEQTRMELFGHATADTQRGYADADAAAHKAAMAKLADLLAPQDLDEDNED